MAAKPNLWKPQYIEHFYQKCPLLLLFPVIYSFYWTFNLLAPEFFFLILAHLYINVYINVNNTGTKYFRIMKQAAF